MLLNTLKNKNLKPPKKTLKAKFYFFFGWVFLWILLGGFFNPNLPKGGSSKDLPFLKTL